jgi:hypothetical protein
MPVWRGIAGLLALVLTAYGLLLLSAAIADRAIALLFAAAAGVAAIPCWWFALRGLAWVQRLLTGFLAIVLTAYALPLVWVSLAHRSPRGSLLGAVIAIIAIPCWRFASREKRTVLDRSPN